MIHGTCSICGGAVKTPDLWGGINPPTPSCVSCGAVPVEAHGATIPMKIPARINSVGGDKCQINFEHSK